MSLGEERVVTLERFDKTRRQEGRRKKTAKKTRFLLLLPIVSLPSISLFFPLTIPFSLSLFILTIHLKNKIYDVKQREKTLCCERCVTDGTGTGTRTILKRVAEAGNKKLLVCS